MVTVLPAVPITLPYTFVSASLKLSVIQTCGSAAPAAVAFLSLAAAAIEAFGVFWASNRPSQKLCRLLPQFGEHLILTRLPPSSPFGSNMVKRDVACSG